MQIFWNFAVVFFAFLAHPVGKQIAQDYADLLQANVFCLLAAKGQNRGSYLIELNRLKTQIATCYGGHRKKYVRLTQSSDWFLPLEIYWQWI